eukprot:1136987-Pelagomonas_calceolata.AAC.2
MIHHHDPSPSPWIHHHGSLSLSRHDPSPSPWITVMVIHHVWEEALESKKGDQITRKHTLAKESRPGVVRI